ncbi:glutathione s-transferase [Striga asiatica]|uniref:Glutathione S-transferase n=1 Tax=Striga asiatica TaxID=4170 RepID=A0A5A7QWI9_STRAF|nr:glutathione s-transferase [Striga asiatica]
MTFFAFFLSTDENREKAAKEVFDTLKIIQDQSLGEKKFFGGEKIGVVDLNFEWLVHWFELMQEFVGLSIFEPTTLPKLHRWTIDFKHEPVIKENLPDSNALLTHFGKFKKELTSPKNE